MTLSFYVKSNKTGTYTINLYKPDNTAYNYVQEYTINSANTWEKKTITISPTAGSTSLITSSAGAINNDTGSGLEIGFSLAWGSDFNTTANTWVAANDYSTTNQVNWMDSTSNNFYLTEVQLEVGDKATPFEHRSFAEELALCQRYYEKSYDYGTAIGTVTYLGAVTMGGGATGSTTSFSPMLCPQFEVRKRTAPTVTVYDQAGTSGKVQRWQLGLTNSNGHTATVADNSETNFKVYSGSGDNASGITCHYEATAEL